MKSVETQPPPVRACQLYQAVVDLYSMGVGDGWSIVYF